MKSSSYPTDDSDRHISGHDKECYWKCYQLQHVCMGRCSHGSTGIQIRSPFHSPMASCAAGLLRHVHDVWVFVILAVSWLNYSLPRLLQQLVSHPAWTFRLRVIIPFMLGKKCKEWECHLMHAAFNLCCSLLSWHCLGATHYTNHTLLCTWLHCGF